LPPDARPSRTSRKFRERFEYRTARAMAKLPPRAQVRLSGKPPVMLDGLTLDPEIQLSLAMLERRNLPGLETLPVDVARQVVHAQAVMSGGPPLAIGSVRDLKIDGAAGDLGARYYTPDEGGGPHPLLVYYHGGGFVICDLDTHDAFCRLLCKHAGVNVLSVDYRMAPEHPFPAPVEDARAALRWAYEHASELGADPERVAVGGDSAGGNLATVVCQLAARDGGPAPSFQLLIYPVTDFTASRPSRELFGEGFFLTQAEMDWFNQHYIESVNADPTDPRVSPLMAEDLSGQPPAFVVTAGFDPLRDEGEEFVRALRAAGVPTAHRRFPGLVHAFINWTGISPVSRDAVVELAGATRAMLSTTAAKVAQEAVEVS
jgi:acetyl esterase